MTITPTIGLFGFIYDQKGKLLVKQREQNESLPGEWDLPGGGVEDKFASEAMDERIVFQELLREVHEELGDISIATAPWEILTVHPVVSAKSKDWAFGINVGFMINPPTRGNYRFVSPDELEELANAQPGNRIVSGCGKRMHRLCLYGLMNNGLNKKWENQAYLKLIEIQKSWK